jgi:hypothetical protein
MEELYACLRFIYDTVDDLLDKNKYKTIRKIIKKVLQFFGKKDRVIRYKSAFKRIYQKIKNWFNSIG